MYNVSSAILSVKPMFCMHDIVLSTQCTKYDCIYTVKPVLRRHHWEKEKVVF